MPAITMRDYRANHAFTIGPRTVSEGNCEIHLDETFLVVKGARTSRIGYEQVESVRLLPKGVQLRLYPEGLIDFRNMDGAMVKPLFHHLSVLRGVRWAYLLRLVDGQPIDGVECKFQSQDGAAVSAFVQLYPNGVVGMPFGEDPFQLPLEDLETIKMTPNYQLLLGTRERSAVLYGCEPTDLGRFQRAVEGARRALEEDTAALLSEVFPALEFAQLDTLKKSLARGRAASKVSLTTVVPWLWERVEATIERSPRSSSAYSYLKSKAQGKLWFGIRRPTEAEKRAEDQSGEAEPAEETDLDPGYLLWYLAGLESRGTRFVVVEVVSGGTGHATYVYRCVDTADPGEAFAATVQVISAAMVSLNFFREPLSAPQHEIEMGRFAEYKLALRKLPYLRTARNLFIGRAIHTNAEAWQSGLEGLLGPTGPPSMESEA